MSPYPGAFEQLFCPGGGAFASSFSKNANSRGSAWGGGGGGRWALLELTDALFSNLTCVCYSHYQSYKFRSGSAFDDLHPRFSLLCDVICPCKKFCGDARCAYQDPSIHPSIESTLSHTISTPTGSLATRIRSDWFSLMIY